MPAADLATVLEANHRALDAFVKGDFTPLHALYAKGDDVTLANPFGPPARGWSQVGETMKRAAANYRGGEAIGFERIAEYATADLAYIVEIERFRTKIGGADEIVPFTLRVTTIFRRDDADWKIVHRHADPITTPRPPQSVVVP